MNPPPQPGPCGIEKSVVLRGLINLLKHIYAMKEKSFNGHLKLLYILENTPISETAQFQEPEPENTGATLCTVARGGELGIIPRCNIQLDCLLKLEVCQHPPPLYP